MLKNRNIFMICALALTFIITSVTTASADKIKLRIASGHPTGVVYAGLMQSYFQPMLAERVAERTDHEIQWIEGYSGTIAKNPEVLEAIVESSAKEGLNIQI